MRKMNLGLLAIAVVLVASGCALTDYDGYADHKTTAEAKLFATEIAFEGFGADFDGTYAYTVKYDNSANGNGKVTIASYRNPVVGSFTREGQIDQDGDDVQGNGGVLGGSFLTRFVAVDAAADCQFGDNVTQDKSAGGAGVFACVSGAMEEIDKDFELHAAFTSLDDLLGQIWSGAVQGDFVVGLTGVTLNGVTYPIETLPITAQAGALRPSNFTITNGAGAASLIRTILDNTQHLEPVHLGLTFEGGLSLQLPAGMVVGFNHDVLVGLL